MLRKLFILELAHFAQTPYFRLRRVIFLGILLCFLYFQIQELQNVSTLGITIVKTCGWFACAMAIILPPVSCSVTVREEKSQSYYDLLQLAGIQTTAIILCRVYVKLLIIALYFASTIPVFLLAVPLGGVSWWQIISVFAAIMVTALFSSTVGVISAINFTNSTTALSRSIAIFFVLFTATGLLPFSVSSPEAIYFFLQGQVGLNRWSGVILQLFYTAILIKIGTRQLYSQVDMIVEIQGQSYTKEKLEKKQAKSFVDVTYQTTTECRQYRKTRRFANPICWRDYHFQHQFSSDFSEKCKSLSDYIASTCNWVFFFFTYTKLYMLSLRIFHNEKRAWHCILLTDLSDRELVIGKLQAVIYGMWRRVLHSLIFITIMIVTIYQNSNTIFVVINVVTMIMYIVMANIVSSFYTRTMFFATICSMVLVFASGAFTTLLAYHLTIHDSTLLRVTVRLVAMYLFYILMVKNIRKKMFIKT